MRTVVSLRQRQTAIRVDGFTARALDTSDARLGRPAVKPYGRTARYGVQRESACFSRSRQQPRALPRKIAERSRPEPHVETTSCPLNRQYLKAQLLREPLPQIGDHNPFTREHTQDRVLEGLKGKCDGDSRHPDATERANPPHSKSDVTVTQPDLRHLETNSGGDTFPDDGHLGGESIALAPEGKIPEPLPLRKKLIEKPLHAVEIERQVEPIPTGKRRRQQIGH
jgi:hypothetical protein